jgi:hypothetical protein
VDKIESNWPVVADESVVLGCERNYHTGTAIKVPSTCACCDRARVGVDLLVVDMDDLYEDYDFLEVLQVPSEYKKPFKFSLTALNGLMLSERGVVEAGILLCKQCSVSLLAKEMPKYALANDLYRGVLPVEFQDLSWVEEMVCALYRNTAHVTRIYNSDPKNPRVFHGNTCAHEMNVLSTASVLPRTPTNIAGMLSVVFIGPGRYKERCLKEMFTIRKSKVWSFLLWLKKNNRLYTNIPLDEALLELYPDVH